MPDKGPCQELDLAEEKPLLSPSFSMCLSTKGQTQTLCFGVPAPPCTGLPLLWCVFADPSHLRPRGRHVSSSSRLRACIVPLPLSHPGDCQPSPGDCRSP